MEVFVGILLFGSIFYTLLKPITNHYELADDGHQPSLKKKKAKTNA